MKKQRKGLTLRILNKSDISNLGPSAKRQVERALSEQGGFHNSRRANNPEQFGKKMGPAPVLDSKKKKPSRVMRTHEGLSYCPWPATDPFVNLHKALEKKYGLYENGGMLVTELIVDGGGKNWRFDFALVSPFKKTKVAGGKTELEMFLGYTCLIEADGFGFHRSKDAFKNDRTKQTHALKQGFAVKRVTNQDVRERLDAVLDDVNIIFSQPRLYENNYTIRSKGKTQFVLQWETD